jgi:hypothetical protein
MLTTYFLPFWSLMTVNTVPVISLQVGLVMFLFTVSSLAGFLTTTSGATGARTFTLIALALSAVSCFVMQHQMKVGN